MTSPKKTKTAAPAAPVVSQFVLACETYGKAQGSARDVADKADAAFMPTLVAHVRGAPKEKGVALDDFKRDIRSHIIAPYMTARGFSVTFDDVRPRFDQGDKKATCKSSAVGAHLSRANDQTTIDLWQDAYSKADGLARVRLTEAFGELGLDIKTGQPKVPPVAGNKTKSGQGKVEPTAPAGTAEAVKATIATAPPSDLAHALAALPAAVRAEVFAMAARISYSSGLTILDRHFADAIVAAATAREKEAATPASTYAPPAKTKAA